MLEVTRAIHQGAGVLYIYGNYGGDIMNFDMAAEMADMEGIKVEQVIAGEDVARHPKVKKVNEGVLPVYSMYIKLPARWLMNWLRWMR